MMSADEKTGGWKDPSTMSTAKYHYEAGAKAFTRGQKLLAIEHFSEALRMLQRFGSTELQQASCLSALGNTLYKLGNHADAAEAYTQALTLYQTIPGTQRDQAECLSTLGGALRSLGRHFEVRLPSSSGHRICADVVSVGEDVHYESATASQIYSGVSLGGCAIGH